MSTLYVQSPTLYLAGAGVVTGATSVILTSFTDIYGNVLTMANFGSLGYITLEPNTSNAEGATFTGVTANANGTYTLTGVKTIIAVSPYTQTSGLVRDHAGGTQVVVTDNVGFWDTFVNKNNDGTMVGYLSGPTPVSSGQYATKGYVDAVAIAGAPTAATTVLGISKLSVDAATATNPIVVGTNDPRVPSQTENDALVGDSGTPSSTNTFITQLGFQINAEKYAADTGGSDTYAVTLSPAPLAYATGMMVIFKANTANTGAATLNVNSLGAKAIVKGLNAALITGDIGGSQTCVVIYDPTYNAFVLTSNIRTQPVLLKVSKDMSSTTTSTIAHGLNQIPKFASVEVNRETTAGTGVTGSLLKSSGSYDGTNQYANYTSISTTGPNSLSSQDITHVIHYGYGTNTVDTDTLVGTMSWDNTNVTITWSKASSPTGTANIIISVY